MQLSGSNPLHRLLETAASDMNGASSGSGSGSASSSSSALQQLMGGGGGDASSSSSSSQQQLPQALQNLQRLLQSQLANVNPLQLQQALQRQQVCVTQIK